MKYLLMFKNKVLRALLKSSDRIAFSVFSNQRYDAVIEMGVHQGEVARYYNKMGNKNYVGYEANIHNIEKYDLFKYNVKNYAVVPENFQNDTIMLNIPIRNNGDDLSSGKSSVLTRKMEGWHSNYALEVNTIQLAKMPFLKDPLLAVGVWIDIEGLSTKIAHEISFYSSVYCIHFEYDIDGNDYEENIFSSLKHIKENFYLLRFRTSHNQFNYIAIKEISYRTILIKFIAEIYNILVELLLIPGRILRPKSECQN